MLKRTVTVLVLLALFAPFRANCDERYFTYVYESTVLPENQWEVEQWITNQNGKEDGDYSEWNLRTEFEYGITDKLMTAFYLNWDSVHADGVPDEESETEFKGVASEWVYQLSNPHLEPIGSALYVELATDGIEYEIEGKLLLSKEVERFVFAANAVYEAEWEREDNRTEHEGTLELTAGAAYRFADAWSAGVEFRNKSAYPGGFDLSGQEYNVLSVGPNLHYGAPKWWATLTVLPQIWGNGEGSQDNLNLVHEESVEVRLIFGILL
ncbi:MAG: transporter [Oligoflexia bacterium]|nr:transporter [Oligoflexia bacterium]